MKIGIIGYGVVGRAIGYGFNRIGHDVLAHDPKLDTEIADILDTEVCFICVPTPQDAEGACDVSIVEEVCRDLKRKAYGGLPVIKSTVTPGTTERLAKETELPLLFCPEFLREQATLSDFVEHHELLVIGGPSDIDVLPVIKAHHPFPQHVDIMSRTEAELLKYFCNTLNAAKIMFANEFFEVCQKLGADYMNIKNAAALRSSVGPQYLDCSKNYREFGGSCLPKDTQAFATFVGGLGLNAHFWQWICNRNSQIRNKRRGLS